MTTKETTGHVAVTDNFICPHCQKEIEVGKGQTFVTMYGISQRITP